MISDLGNALYVRHAAERGQSVGNGRVLGEVAASLLQQPAFQNREAAIGCGFEQPLTNAVRFGAPDILQRDK